MSSDDSGWRLHRVDLRRRAVPVGLLCDPYEFAAVVAKIALDLRHPSLERLCEALVALTALCLMSAGYMLPLDRPVAIRHLVADVMDGMSVEEFARRLRMLAVPIPIG